MKFSPGRSPAGGSPGRPRLGGRVWIEEKPWCCPICSHPWTDRIEAAVMSGMKDVDVEAMFHLDPGIVAHHCQVCIPRKGFCKPEQKPEPESEQKGKRGAKPSVLVPVVVEAAPEEAEQVFTARGMARRLERYIRTMEAMAEAMCRSHGEGEDAAATCDPKALAVVVAEARKGIEALTKMHLEAVRLDLELEDSRRVNEIIIREINKESPECRARIVAALERERRNAIAAG